MESTTKVNAVLAAGMFGYWCQCLPYAPIRYGRDGAANVRSHLKYTHGLDDDSINRVMRDAIDHAKVI